MNIKFFQVCFTKFVGGSFAFWSNILIGWKFFARMEELLSLINTKICSYSYDRNLTNNNRSFEHILYPQVNLGEANKIFEEFVLVCT